ncbi:MAG: lipopolysaccharide heptosyltransferase family protein [Pelagibacteraceae bacterium]|nr:lipopolysaccharide heptosyltransferase family protein [Pelagibacteraceae bacterium]
MSNILIIKHGSLGDIAQASGAIQDIYQNHPNDQIHILTTQPYVQLFEKNPMIHNVLLDKRSSRLNLIYLYHLTKNIKKFSFIKIFDLQNSSRSIFYKNIFFPKANYQVWSSSSTTLPKNTDKNEFDKKPVLDRFDHQLKTSGLKTLNTLKPDFSWACEDITEIKKKFNLKKYIILFPFCSEHLTIKKWPFFNDLIKLISDKFNDQYQILTAPGPTEIKEANNFNAKPILIDNKALNISQLASLIKDSSFVVANDTGPAHMAAHLGVKGLTLFGKHTSAYKVSIERENFKAIQVADLYNLSAEKVFEQLIVNIN